MLDKIMKNSQENDENAFRKKITFLSFLLCMLVVQIHTFNLETYGCTAQSTGFSRFVWALETYMNAVDYFAVYFFSSFFVYVAHDILLECFEKVLWVVFKNNPVIALADYLLMPILIVATLSGIAYVLIMYFPRLWKTISENRINKEAVIK